MDDLSSSQVLGKQMNRRIVNVHMHTHTRNGFYDSEIFIPTMKRAAQIRREQKDRSCVACAKKPTS